MGVWLLPGLGTWDTPEGATVVREAILSAVGAVEAEGDRLSSRV